MSHRAAADEGDTKGEIGEGVGKKEDAEKKRLKVGDVGVIDLALVKTDPNKLYPLIYYAFKVSSKLGCVPSY